MIVYLLGRKKKCNESEKDSSFGRGARAWPGGVFKVTPEMVIWREMRAGSHHSGEMMKEDPCNIVANTIHPEPKYTLNDAFILLKTQYQPF